MSEEERPDPETLLKAIQADENKRGKGRLKIFLGMSAGVGKTYTMLEEAKQKAEEGVDVYAGLVETHGRLETARLLEPLKKIPEKEMIYKEKIFKELDIDEILRIKPQLVLIDELAHTNIPGSRNLKRWQDVVEILDAGIDVYTTVNIQHIESQKDVVEGITGIKIRESVPDRIIEQASDIAFIDITPPELLQRLKEGKVYTGDLSEIALRNFFQEDRLTALREIALRFTAEMVDLELNTLVTALQKGKGWKPRERLLVAINHLPYAQQLIRSTRRLAFALHAPWTLLYVDTGKNLDDEESRMLSKHFALARELGGDVITIQDLDVAKGIQRVAEQKNVTQIFIGSSLKRKIIHLFRPSLADKLSTVTTGIDIHIIRQTAPLPHKKVTTPKNKSLLQLIPYLHILMWTAVVTFFCTLIAPHTGYKTVGMIFVLSILLFSLYFERGPLLFSAIAYACFWSLFFLPSLLLSEDSGFLVLFFLAALITGELRNRMKKRQDLLGKKERSTRAIYEIVREIGTAPTSAQLFKGVKERLGSILQGSCEIIVRTLEGEMRFEEGSSIEQDEKEKAVASWVFKKGKEAGWSTTALPSVKNLYLPLKGIKEVVGVLAFHPKTDRPLLPEESNFLYTVAQLLGNFLERSLVERREINDQFIQQVEQIYVKILQSIAEELYRPLGVMQETVEECKKEKKITEDPQLASSLYKVDDVVKSLMHIAENAQAMAELSGGFVKFEKSLHRIEHLVEAVCKEMEQSLKEYQLKIHYGTHLPPVPFDFSLMSILLHHLLSNATEYSPPHSTIEIETEVFDQTFILSVLDEGKGIPEEVKGLIFERFYRVEGTVSTGLGLGLSIVKSIVDMHHGQIRVINRTAGGTKFSLLLPL